jgi:hypothetical protein
MDPTDSEKPPSTTNRTRTYVSTGRPRGRPRGAKTRPKAPEMLPTIKPEAMRLKSASAYVGLSGSMLRKLAAKKQIETVTVGRARLFLTRSLDRLLGIDGD